MQAKRYEDNGYDLHLRIVNIMIKYLYISICAELQQITLQIPLIAVMGDDRYVFVVQWFDSTADLVRSYNLTYFLVDHTIDMFDIKNKRIFLKRCQYSAVQLQDIYIGATLNIYSRQLKVVDFADQFTRGKFEKQTGKTLALIKPDAYMAIGKIINIIQESGFHINNIKIVKMSEQQAQKLLSDQRDKPQYKQNAAHLSSDLVVALELVAENCVSKWLGLIGPGNPQVAKKENPKSIRAQFGQDQIRNAVWGSETSTSAPKQFSSLKCPAYFNNCSCAVIKPHIVTEGYVGQIIDQILAANFEISAMQMFWLDKPSAEEFLEIYKTLLPEFSQLVQELTRGPCIALQVRQNNPVPALRELCGPNDPQMARSLKPKSIRSQFGKDKARNAIHCTDLMEDALIQVQYFFNILQK